MPYAFNPFTNNLDYYETVAVTDVSVADANGFNGTVATPTTTPVITLTTTQTGVLTGNGISISGVAALPANLGGTGVSNNAASTITVSGAFPLTATLTGATNVTFPTSGTLSTSTGTVTSVSGTANQVSVATGTTTPVISLIGPYTPSTYLNNGVILGAGSGSLVSTTEGTLGQLFQSGGSSPGNWTTSTYPATNAINTLIYASAANVMTALATANNGVLITSADGVPSILPEGTTGQVLTTVTTGSPPSWANPPAPLVVSRQSITTTAVYTPTSGSVLYCDIEVQAAGGGGGGTSTTSTGTSAGGGGASGAYQRLVVPVASATGLTATIGAAGTAGVANGANGGIGGTTSFGGIISCAGGGGGGTAGTESATYIGIGGPGGTGGVTSGGNINVDGTRGATGIQITGAAIGGAGANSIYGAGGYAVGPASTSSSGFYPGINANATGYGAGGGGAASSGAGGTGQNGGTGSAGIVIITEYA